MLCRPYVALSLISEDGVRSTTRTKSSSEGESRAEEVWNSGVDLELDLEYNHERLMGDEVDYQTTEYKREVRFIYISYYCSGYLE